MKQYCIKLKEQYTEKVAVPKIPNIKIFLSVLILFFQGQKCRSHFPSLGTSVLPLIDREANSQCSQRAAVNKYCKSMEQTNG